MSSKFKKQQQRKRWSEAGTVFPEVFCCQAQALGQDAAAPPVLQEIGQALLNFTTLRSTYAEIEALKGICAKVVRLATSGVPQGRDHPPQANCSAHPQPQHAAANGSLTADVNTHEHSSDQPSSGSSGRECNSQPDTVSRSSCTASGDAMLDGSAAAVEALRLLTQLLFLDSSRPIHRQLLSSLRALPPSVTQAFHDLVVEQVQAVATAANDAAALERSSVAGQQPRSSGEQPPMSSRAPLADVMVTLLEHPTLKLALRPCCVAAVQCLANGVRKVVGGGEAGRHIPPSVMDETQDAISSLYYLLVTYGSDIAMEGGAAGRHAILTAAEAMLEALQGASLAREALSSAAVALSAAARLPSVQPAVSALEIAEGLDLAPQPGMLGLAEGLQGIDAGIVAEQLAAAGTSLPQRLRQLSAFAKICALKGLVSMLPTAVLCAPLQLHHPQGSPHDANSSGTAAVQPGPAADIANGQTQEAWCWLSRGALPAACAGVLVASDAHYKFHAMSTLTVCLQRMKEILAEAAVHRTNSLQAPPSSEQADAQRSPAPSSPQSDGAPGRPAGSHEASGTEAGIWAVTLGAEGHDTEAGSATQSSAGSGKEGWDLQLPVLTAALRSQVMGLLWSNWDEPLSQTVKQVQAAFDAVLHILAVQQQYQRVLAVAQEDAIGVDAFLEHTTRDLLQTGGPRKGRYIPLTGLVPRLGAKRMLSLRPGLLEDTLSAQREQALCSCASGLFSALLQELRQECMQDADQPSEGLRAWREYWVGPMLHVLMSPNECLRSNASMYSLPVALQMDSGSLLLLLGYVLDEDAAMPACDVGGQALEDGLFEDGKVAALVAILKAARQLQLISDLDVVTVPGCGSVTIPESMLQRAISHCTESLRVDAMQLACVHPKATAPPGALELQLVALGLSLGMRCTSTSLRNKWMSLFGKLLRRIHTAVHAIVHRRHLRQLSMAAAVKRGKPDRAEVAALENAEELKDLQRLVAFMQWLTRSLLGSLYPGAPFERKYLATLLLNTLLEVRGEAGILSPAHEGPLDLLCPGFEGPTAVEVLLGAVVDSWDRLREGSITALMHMATPLPGLDRPELLPPVLGWACRLVGSPRVRESDAGARLLGLVYSKYILGLHWHVQVSCQSSSTAGSQSCTCLDEGATSAFSASMVFLDSINGWLQANVEAGKQDLPEACRNSLAHGVLLLLRYLVPAVPWGAFAGLPGQAQAMRRWLQRLLGLMEEAVQLTMEALAQPQKASIGAGEIDAGDLEVGLSDAEDEEGEEEGAGELAPRSQMITTGCWLTMKEVSLVWGTLARCIPLEGDEKSGHGYLLSAEQLQHIGASFITILTSMKHNGAVDKTQAGFIAMVEKLLRVPSPALNRLPGEWMANLLLHICRAGQSRDDIVRRSAGIPFAFCALFLAEPVGQHKVLLHGGMSALLDLAGDTAQAEPWPRVHAFNVLRMAFNDKNLAMDSSGFFAEGLKTAILGMSAPAWEVRNAASQLYTALVVRTLGFKNVTKGSTLRRTITGAEFFYRYQLLHSFLLGQLEEAAQQLESDTSSSSPVHPSLYPVLVLLSRLRPSLHNRSTALVNRLTPAAFTPVVQRCACARPLAIRHLAARALAPLVPPEELAATLADLLGQVPVAGAIQHANKVHGALLQLHALLEIDDQRLQAIDAHALLDLLLPALQQRMWLLTLRNPCGPIRLEFVRVVRACLALPDAAGHSLRVAFAEAVVAASSAVLVGTQPAAHAAAMGSDATCTSDSPSIPGLPPSTPPAPPSTSTADSNGNGSLSNAEPASTPPHRFESADAADPMSSIWLKELSALFFGPLLPFTGSARCEAPLAVVSATTGLAMTGQAAVQARGSVAPLASVAETPRTSTPAVGTAAYARQLWGPATTAAVLAHPAYEVRAAALKAIAAHMQHRAQGASPPAWLRPLLLERLRQEHQHKAMRRTLHLLAMLPLHPASRAYPSSSASKPGAAAPVHRVASQPEGEQWPAPAVSTGRDEGASSCPPSCGSPSDLATARTASQQWHLLQSIRQAARHPLIQDEALRCLGAALKPLVAPSTRQPQPTSPEDVAEAVQQFLAAITSSSSGRMAVSVRQAAVQALQASGLLNVLPPPTTTLAASAVASNGNHKVPGWLQEASLQAWLLAIQLMEDEADEVREVAAAAAAEAIAQLSGVDCRNAHVELVERQTFILLTSCCSHMPSFHSQLLTWIYPVFTPTSVLQPAGQVHSAAGRCNGAGMQQGADVMGQTSKCSAAQDGGNEQPYVPGARHSQPCISSLSHDAEFAASPSYAGRAQQAAGPSATSPRASSAAANGARGASTSTCAPDPLLSGNGSEPAQLSATASVADAAPAGASAAASSALGLLRHWQPGSVRKLFDRELDNHHEEQLLLAQLAAGRLRALLMAASAPGLRPAVQGWADRVAQEVEMACQALQRLQQTTSWLGGVTNHPHTFGPLFRMLLALYAAGALAQRAHADVAGAEEPIAAPATGPAHQPHVAGVLSRCVDIMLKLQLHPLLSSLLVVALEQWDIADLRTQAVQALGEAYDPSFNPLFLVGTYMRHVPVVAAPTVAPQDTLLPHLASLTLDA